MENGKWKIRGNTSVKALNLKLGRAGACSRRVGANAVLGAKC